ncbi:MAG TPA: OsmC family protein [Devosiaceae bacterium]|nr:OsmC family protein [Devosiaceae bacterium]
MTAHVTARPVSVSATLGGAGTGSVTAASGASAALAGLAADPGFTPLEFMDAALSGCLVLSVRIAARKHGWGERLLRVDVVVSHEKAPEAPSRVAAFNCSFEIIGDFSAEERALLIAEAHEICTVGNTFERGAVIRDVVDQTVAIA